MGAAVFDRRTQLVFLLPTFAIIFNCLLSFFDRQSGLAVIKGLLFIGLLAYLYMGKIDKAVGKFAIFFLLLIYWLTLIPFSSDQERSLQSIIRAALSIMMLPLGFCYINTPKKMARFAYVQQNVCIIFVVFALLSNVFKWGITQYGASSVRVGLYDAQLYAPALALTLVPFIFQTHKLSKFDTYKIYVTGFLVFIFLMLSMRRTSVGIVVMGISIFYGTSGKIQKLLGVFMIVFFILVITFPLYGSFLLERMALRTDVFNNEEYEMTEELRVRELFLVLKDLAENFSIFTLLFGKEIFNSPGHYGFNDGFLSVRQLHVDYTVLFHGSGLVGLFMYLSLFGRIYHLFVARYRKFKSIFGQFSTDIRALFIVSFTMVIFISFSGQMEELSFRSILFLILGGCLGVIYNTTAKIKPITLVSSEQQLQEPTIPKIAATV